jgi:hypothetical protein
MKYLKACVLFLCVLIAPSLAWSDDDRVAQQSSAPTALLVDAGKPGPVFDLEFVGNTSRLNAFLGVSSGSEILHDETRFATASSPKEYIHTHFPNFSAIRIGNLFFGYECSGANFQEMAVRGSGGGLRYQFEETIQLIDELLRSGLKPYFALTGIPKAMVPDGEAVISHHAYGCVNAPALDWSKSEPKERVRDWWQLQDAFMRALIAHFGINEVKTWEFATWTEPLNPEGKKNHHLVLPKSVIQAGRHDEAVATIIAASIDVAMDHDLPIHIGNFAGPVEQAYPKIIDEIRRFPKGEAYLKYIRGYAISRYRVNPEQDIGRSVDSAFSLLNNPTMPDKPLFIDVFGELIMDDGYKPFKMASSLDRGVFVGTVLARAFNRQDGSGRVPKRVAFWDMGINSRAKFTFSQYDDYLKTPATHVIDMFASMNGFKKLLVPTFPLQAVAGVKDGRSKIILIAGEGSDHLGAAFGGIEIRGLKANVNYQVEISRINVNYGDPLTVFLGGEQDYRDNFKKRFAIVDGEWKLASKYWERCFFNEVRECAWREQAHLVDTPLIRKERIKADAFGVVRVSVDMPGSAAVMVDVIEQNFIMGAIK